ncbi:MAG TPA: hypothetical protein VM013_04405 [Dehalococcoidia bacterium]|nr:hypothetical protein [Dehalococcoidia bacterium]
MNGFGVGAAIAVGVEIGATIVSPELDLNYVLMLMVLYGAFIGYIFAIWKIALKGVHLSAFSPFAESRRRSSEFFSRLVHLFFFRSRSP